MSLTVGDLLRVPHLGLRLHAGAGGLVREVTWTHASDLPEPWPWLSAGDLLLSNGMSLPKGPEEQVHLLEQLDRAGASGLALAEEMYCPALTAEFDEAAERLAFPVLWVKYPTPFVTISRAVGEATLLEQSRRVMRTERMYEAIRLAAGGDRNHSHTAVVIAKELGCSVYVCDRATGAAYYPGDESPSPQVRDVVRHAAEGVLVTGLRSATTVSGDEVLVLEVPTRPSAVLAAVHVEARPLNAVLLHHASTVVALELWHTHQALEYDRRAGAELAVQVIHGRADGRRVRRDLLTRSLDPAMCVLVAATCLDDEKVRGLHVALWRQQVPHAVALQNSIAHLILPADDTAVAAVVEALAPDAAVGVSRLLGRVLRGPETDRESVWALGIAQRTGRPLVRYGVATAWSGIADLTDARAVVEQWLGPLLSDDAEHGGDLMETLRAFLTNKRSWQRTATALRIHRQTVLYRVHKIERITSSDLSETATIAHFWLALEAHDLLSASGKA